MSLSLREEGGKKSNSIYEFTLTGLKDLKEIKISNVDFTNPTLTPGAFVYGKINQVTPLRFGFGKEFILSRRPDRNSIGAYWHSSVGLTIGLQTPVFIDYVNPGANDIGFVTVRYDPNLHQRQNIIQSYSFLKGLSQAELLPGIYTKQGTVLEFGNYTYTPNRVEAGFMLEAFFIRPDIMYQRKHPNIFLSFYLSFAILNFGI